MNSPSPLEDSQFEDSQFEESQFDSLWSDSSDLQPAMMNSSSPLHSSQFPDSQSIDLPLSSKIESVVPETEMEPAIMNSSSELESAVPDSEMEPAMMIISSELESAVEFAGHSQSEVGAAASVLCSAWAQRSVDRRSSCFEYVPESPTPPSKSADHCCLVPETTISETPHKEREAAAKTRIMAWGADYKLQLESRSPAYLTPEEQYTYCISECAKLAAKREELLAWDSDNLN